MIQVLKDRIELLTSQGGKYLKIGRLLSFLFLLLVACVRVPASSRVGLQIPVTSSPITYLPLVINGNQQAAMPGQGMHIPYFDTTEDLFNNYYEQMGVFWFGKVTPNDTYTDVRVGYNRDGLYVNLAIIDRLLWYAPPTSPADLLKWDSASLYIHIPQNGSSPEKTARFDAELNWWEPRPDYQASFERTGSGWQQANLTFTTISGWEGNAPNDMVEDRGWFISYEIPFSSLGVLATPGQGESFQMGITVNNRNSGSASTILSTSWPDGFGSDDVTTWGNIIFGIPVYSSPAATNPKTVTVRQGNGVTVKDGSVGGWTTCGDGLDFWNQWGNQVYTGQQAEVVNVQNQHNIADWPCFSRYYVTFPLDAVPRGKKIISAQLTLHQFGNSDPTQAQGSIIQVLKVNQDWDANALSWNNSPQAVDNYGGTWVDPLPGFPGWPGVARQWDISEAVAEAYASNSPVLRLAMYSADWPLHSGKYFSSSRTGDWNAAARPALAITYGN